MYMYIAISILLLIYPLRSYMHARMHACVSVWIHCAHRCRYVSILRPMARVSVGARVSIAIHSSMHICLCMDIRLYLDACILSAIETRVWACVCADARAGAPAWVDICLRVQSPLRTHRCAYHAHAGVCACNAWSPLHGFGPFLPTSAHCRGAGAGRTRVRFAAGSSPPRR